MQKYFNMMPPSSKQESTVLNWQYASGVNHVKLNLAFIECILLADASVISIRVLSACKSWNLKKKH